jgi:hypothetical protein
MYLHQLKTSPINQVLELSRRSLNSIDASHQTKIAMRLEATKVSIVCWERRRSRREFVAAVGGVHDLLAKEDARFI